MPFDEGHLLRGAIDYVANRSVVGKVVMHPIWFSVLLVTVIILVLMTVWDGQISFKLVFYMLAGVTCAVVAHDAFLQQRSAELQGTNVITDMVEDMQTSGNKVEIEPRESAERPPMYVAAVDGGDMTADSLLGRI